MSDRYFFPSTYVSNRDLLCKVSMQDLDDIEIGSVYQYRKLVDKIAEEQEEIQWLSKQKGMEASVKESENKIVQYNIELSRMESEYPLRYLIKRLREKEQAEQVVKEVHEEPSKARKANRPRKKKSIIKVLNRLSDEGVFTALTYIITFFWFGYLVSVVATADTHIIGKIFFVVWSLVLAFLFAIHKFGGSDDD